MEVTILKKIVSLILVLVFAVAMIGCGSKGNKPAGGTSAMEALPKDASPAQTVVADFTDKVNSGEYDSAEALAEALSEASYLPFGGAFMVVEEGYLNGFNDEIKGFSEGAMFGPVIGSIPFVAYVFKTDDAAALMKDLEGAADLRWNICTQADEMKSENTGDYVCFVMAPAAFEE